MSEQHPGPIISGEAIASELRRRKSKDFYKTDTGSTKKLIAEKVALEERRRMARCQNEYQIDSNGSGQARRRTARRRGLEHLGANGLQGNEQGPEISDRR
ncbi:hypothetical protein [Agrobacterium tumefaciens]|uniref:hypothetical protein n=1 Tax=Agrobacterium tumefaciens TaxID=358 RepID=UPI0012D35367|nr:hypothetical protein [Agrobacterium tumefaciens]